MSSLHEVDQSTASERGRVSVSVFCLPTIKGISIKFSSGVYIKIVQTNLILVHIGQIVKVKVQLSLCFK
jgi:hypothetical protein